MCVRHYFYMLVANSNLHSILWLEHLMMTLHKVFFHEMVEVGEPRVSTRVYRLRLVTDQCKNGRLLKIQKQFGEGIGGNDPNPWFMGSFSILWDTKRTYSLEWKYTLNKHLNLTHPVSTHKMPRPFDVKGDCSGNCANYRFNQNR